MQTIDFTDVTIKGDFFSANYDYVELKFVTCLELSTSKLSNGNNECATQEEVN